MCCVYACACVYFELLEKSQQKFLGKAKQLDTVSCLYETNMDMPPVANDQINKLTHVLIIIQLTHMCRPTCSSFAVNIMAPMPQIVVMAAQVSWFR